MEKKLLSVITAATLFLASASSYAVPTYGTDTLDKNKIAIGYQNNIIFRHDLNDMNGTVRSDMHFLDLSFGATNWLTIDGKIGTGNLLWKGGVHPKVDFGYGFAGGYGFRLKAWDSDKYKARTVFGFHHISVHPTNRNVGTDKYESIADDWQFSIVVSKDLGRFRPFIGAKASRSDLVYKVNEIDRKRKLPEYYGGVVAGCSVKLTDSMYTRVEAHFVDEASLSTGIYYTF